MKKLLGIPALFAALAAVLLVFGWFQPREHVASSRIELRVPPAAVWALITDHPGMPAWRTGLEKVERGPDQDGKPVWIETSGFGPMPLCVDAMEPPRLYRLRIAADDLGFGGTWTYEIEPAGPRSGTPTAPAAEGSGCRLTITEDGFVDSILFRALGPFMGGHHAAMDQYLRDLATALDQSAEPVHVALKS